MGENTGSDTGKDAFDLVRLSRYFYELSPQPMVVVEGTTHIVGYLNDAFARLVGKEPTELMGRPLAEALPEGKENPSLSLLDRVYRTGTPEVLVEQEHRLTPPAYWSYSAWATFGGDKRPVAIILKITNTTEMAIFRQQMIGMNE